MGKAFTTSAAVAEADKDGMGEDRLLAGAQEFLLLCKDGNVAEAVHALHYLPQNYKLMVLAEVARSAQHDTSWMDNTSLKSRIQFEDTGTAEERASLYSFADAIISDGDDTETVATTTAPYVVVSANAPSGITNNGARGFTVPSDSPEALASAILHIARAS